MNPVTFNLVTQRRHSSATDHVSRSTPARRRRSLPKTWTAWGVPALAICSVLAVGNMAFSAPPLDFESDPINYTTATPNNVVTRLQAAIDDGETTLPFEDQFGYLRSVLKELEVPESSQMLTFLKSSLQRPLIEPQNARALYFGDDAYVGYVPGGMLELIVSDEKLGLVFYTLEQTPERPEFERQVSHCMTCHSSSRTKSIPGLQVRSMMTAPNGEPVISAGSYRTDHSSPFSKRWGGWFVTGTHGKSQHLGNFQLPNRKRPKKPVDNSAGTNVTDLSALTDLSKQLNPHSDIVALMVFEHQIDAHNLMVRTNYAWQLDQHEQRESASDAAWKQEADQLVGHLLFTTEHRLEHPVQGTSRFATKFSERDRSDDHEPNDDHGRSLRQFDLTTKLFKYPYSYTIESQMFRSLPQPVRRFVTNRMAAGLTATQEGQHMHLTADDQSYLEAMLTKSAGIDEIIATEN